MDPISFYSAILISLISAAGITANNVLNNRKELALRELEQKGEDRSRLLGQKHAAYAELLRSAIEMGRHLNRPKEGDEPIAAAFWIATDQAKLVSTPATAELVEAYGQAFFTTRASNARVERKAMMEAFAVELGTVGS
jgi:hypothetical protein